MPQEYSVQDENTLTFRAHINDARLSAVVLPALFVLALALVLRVPLPRPLPQRHYKLRCSRAVVSSCSCALYMPQALWHVQRYMPLRLRRRGAQARLQLPHGRLGMCTRRGKASIQCLFLAALAAIVAAPNGEAHRPRLRDFAFASREQDRRRETGAGAPASCRGDAQRWVERGAQLIAEGQAGEGLRCLQLAVRLGCVTAHIFQDMSVARLAQKELGGALADARRAVLLSGCGEWQAAGSSMRANGRRCESPEVIYLHTYTFICVYVCIYVCMHACMCVCVCMYACMHVCMYVCMYGMYVWYVCMYTHACICVCMYKYVCACMCMRVRESGCAFIYIASPELR